MARGRATALVKSQRDEEIAIGYLTRMLENTKAFGGKALRLTLASEGNAECGSAKQQSILKE